MYIRKLAAKSIHANVHVSSQKHWWPTSNTAKLLKAQCVAANGCSVRMCMQGAVVRHIRLQNVSEMHL
jgi:hypothetical protein